MKENWKKLASPFERYEVSDMGRVRNSKTRHVFRGGIVNGYSHVYLTATDGSGSKSFRVHRIVASTFYGCPKNHTDLEVNHINGDRSDNRAANLEWCTRSANTQKKTTWGGKSGRPVIQRILDGSFLARHERIADTGFPRHGILNNCQGRSKSAYGYQWEYAEDKIAGEVWREVDTGTEIGSVKVSSQGRVELQSRKQSFGWGCGSDYRVVTFDHQKWHTKKTFMVHRLVALAFCPLPQTYKPDKLQIDHINGQKDDNRAVNLRWVTASQNCQAANDARTEPRNRYQRAIIGTCTKTGNEIEFASLKEAAKSTPDAHPQNIGKVLRGLRPSAGGYKWRDAHPRPN